MRESSNYTWSKHDPAQPSSVWDNMVASSRYMLSSEMSYSDALNNEMFIERNLKLEEWIKDGILPKDVKQTYESNYTSIALYAKHNLGLDIETDQELRDQKAKVINQLGQDRAELASRATFTGKAMGMIAGMGTAMLDVDVLIGTVAGGWGPLIKGLSTGKKLATVAALGAALETPRQSQVYKLKSKLELGASVPQALGYVALAGGAETVAIGLGMGLKSLKTSKVQKILNDLETSYEGKIPSNVQTEITKMRAVLDSGVSENAEEAFTGLQKTMDEFESPEWKNTYDMLSEMAEARKVQIDEGVTTHPPTETTASDGITYRFLGRQWAKVTKSGKTSTSASKKIAEELGMPGVKKEDMVDDVFDFLDDEGKAYLAKNPKLAEELTETFRTGRVDFDILTECLVGNGIKI